MASGEKLANILSAFVMTLGGLVIAFVIGWKFAFVCLGILPPMFVGIALMAVMAMQRNKSKYYD